jgi:hypothetical protein
MAIFRSTPQIFTLYDTTLTQSNSTSFVASTKTLTLPAGTYIYSGYVSGNTVSLTGGVYIQLTQSLTGSGCFSYFTWRGSDNFTHNTSQGSFRRADSNAQLSANIIMDGGATSKSIQGFLVGTLILTTAQTFGFQIAQRTVTDASNPAIMSTGCYISYTKIA